MYERGVCRVGKEWLWSMLPLVMLFFCGCEEGRLTPGDGHDFGANNPAVVVALGDSITRGNQNGVSAPFPSVLAGLIGQPVVNAGVGGEQSGAGLGRIQSVLDANRPGFMLILFGANDLIHGQSPATVVANVRAMAERARASQTIPIIATMTPTAGSRSGMMPAIESINNALRALAASEDFYLADLAAALGGSSAYLLDDGLHPNQDAHNVMGRVFANVLTN